MARRRRQHHEEHENHERWLVSYADFITLLFAFFVVMYAVSRVDNERLVQVSESIRFAMHFEGTGGVGDLPIFDGPQGGAAAALGPGGAMTLKEQVRAEKIRRQLERRIGAFLDPTLSHVILEVEGRRLVLRLAASRFFDPGEAALHPAAIGIVDAIAAELRTLDLPVRVEAHTDDRPIRTAAFRNNWELSAARAATVVAYVAAAHDFPAARLSAVGMGAARPVASNETEAGREANRRIEFVVELTPGSFLESIAP